MPHLTNQYQAIINKTDLYAYIYEQKQQFLYLLNLSLNHPVKMI